MQYNHHEMPKFPVGIITVSEEAVRTLSLKDILTSLSRHITGDWGIEVDDNWAANNRALSTEGRLISVFVSLEKTRRFFIITEPDRSSTTVMLPIEY